MHVLRFYRREYNGIWFKVKMQQRTVEGSVSFLSFFERRQTSFPLLSSKNKKQKTSFPLLNK
jgi:hypothetical protein